jgi:hypothetical protein
MHGVRSREWLDERRMLNELVRETREIEDMLNAVNYTSTTA